MTEDLSIEDGTLPPPGQSETQAHAAARPRGRPAKAAARQPVREPMREPGRGAVVEHNGEVLSRRRKEGGDPFEIPPHLIPDGMTYQWNAVSVKGDTDVVTDLSMGMYENGWRPVPAARHPGYFVPRGTAGAIIRGGCRLEERPKILTEEAAAESVAIAKRQLYDQNQSVMGKFRQAMGPGLEMNGQYKGSGGQMKMSIDRGLDIPAPGNYEMAEPGQ